MYNKRRTKIIATLGPATDNPGILEKMLIAGVDLVRLNFSHGTVAQHQQRQIAVREISKKIGREVGILADLQGPKIRIGRFKQGKIQLVNGAPFILDCKLDEHDGDQNQVGITYKELINDVKAHDILLLADGLITLQVVRIEQHQIHTVVISGGELSDSKGINRQGGGLSAPALTDKDREDLIAAVRLGVDYIAISFPRSAADIHYAKRLIADAGGNASVIAKIERTEAIDNIEEIIHASDAIMIARGDLGVEMGDSALPGIQKRIISRTRSLNKAVITATQMMESMIHNAIPTRAEVFDVANAVLDGTDAVMLSAETASGEHPHKVVEAMDRICLGAEREKISKISRHRMDWQFSRTDEAIAMATMYTANHLQITAIISLTESGSTPLWMSRIRSGIPIYALTSHESTRRRVMLYRGVYPIPFDTNKHTKKTINKAAIETLRAYGEINENDLIILTKGDLIGVHGGTNSMKILKVGFVE